MRFGVCAEASKAALLAEAGYDYIELSVAGDLMPDSDEAAWTARRHELEKLPLPAETFNSFVRTGKIVGPDADADRLRRYVANALTRAGQIGGKVVVFGSGGARNTPEGCPPAQAQAQLRDFLNWCADASDQTGVIVAIEPLRSAESNVLNRVSEGAALARAIAHPGVRNLADTYHMEGENEPLSAIVDSADVLAHVHTADTDRFAPGTGYYDHAAFFRSLRDAHYDSRCSIECTWRDFAGEIGPALAHLQAAQTA